MTLPAFERLVPPGTDIVSDPYQLYAMLREQGPVHRVPSHGTDDVWLIVGHEEARAALTDPRMSNDVRHSSSWQDDGGNAIGLNMLQTDPPDHTRLRKLVAREFTARRIEALRPRIRQIADELLDAMLPLGRADLVESFAMPLPMAVICELLGVPAADRADFRGWSSEIVFPSGPEAAGAAVAAMTGYLARLIETKREAESDDLLSALVRTMDEDGDRLSSEEMLGMAFLLLVAGHETTVNLLSNGTCALLRAPEQLAALRADYALLDAAVEEMLRYDGPSQSTAHRFTTEPWRSRTPRSPRVSPSWCCSARPTATRGASPTPTASTSTGTPGATWASATASTTVWARRWPGWRPRSRCGPCWSGVRTWPWTPTRTPWPGAPA